MATATILVLAATYATQCHAYGDYGCQTNADCAALADQHDISANSTCVAGEFVPCPNERPRQGEGRPN